MLCLLWYFNKIHFFRNMRCYIRNCLGIAAFAVKFGLKMHFCVTFVTFVALMLQKYFTMAYLLKSSALFGIISVYPMIIHWKRKKRS